MRSFTTLALAAFVPTVLAHSWVEQLMVIGLDGFFTGAPGYPRANVRRDSPGFGDPAMVNLIPGKGATIQQSEPMCKSSQSKPNQSEGSPALKATPGSLVALRYQENGHVTLPQNQLGKAENRGSVYIYGTTDPQPTDTFLSIHNVWNAEGTGGDKRGKLLATQNFDDGQCYQINGGSISQKRQSEFPHEPSPLMGQDLWCQNNIKLPSEATAGQMYTLYWVWDWSTAPNVDPGLPKGKPEIYTTCMDVEVTNEVAPQSKMGAPAVKNVQQKQDRGNSAISSLIAPLLESSPSSANAPAPSAAAQSAEPSSASSRSSQFTPESQPPPTAASATATTVTVTATETATIFLGGPRLRPSATTLLTRPAVPSAA